MTTPRVAVWGTGLLGQAFIRLITERSDLELVGAVTYSADKAGRDIGEGIGIGPVGALATKSAEELKSWAPDIVLHVPMDLTGWSGLEEIEDLLASGINVITALAYRGLPWRDKEVFDRLQSAGERGGSTFYVTGVNPDFVGERMVLTMSGLCADIKQIHLTEIFRADKIGPLMYHVCGFGQEISTDTTTVDVVTDLGGRYFEPSIQVVADAMGVTLDEIVATNLSTPSPVDVDLGDRTVEAGTMAVLKLRWEGRSDGRPFYVAEAIYYCGEENRPPQAVAEECWLLEIEGTPSIRVAVETLSSLDESVQIDADDPVTPGYYAIAATFLQAVPLVLDAAAGVLENPRPAVHWQRPSE